MIGTVLVYLSMIEFCYIEIWAIFYERITNAQTYRNQPTEKTFQQHENEKKRSYMHRGIIVETFTLLVMGTNGGMGEECK